MISTFTVAQLGPVNRPELEMSVNLANLTQQSFHFDLVHRPLRIDRTKYSLPNRTYDLDRAARDILKRFRLPRPLILFTSLPYGDSETGRKKDWFYFSDHSLAFDPKVAIISTHLWRTLPGERRLQPYVLCSLAAATITSCVGIEEHYETHGCIFDYCDDPLDIDRCFSGDGLCSSCQNQLQTKLRQGGITVAQIASSMRLFNRAAGRNLCFVIMPFRNKLNRVYETVRSALGSEGWLVFRADEVPQPRRITDAIIQSIWTADLIIADLTESNPNVFYEVGIAHTIGKDVVFLSQEPKIPFDVAPDRAIFYRMNRPSLKKMGLSLRKHVGSVHYLKPVTGANHTLKPTV